MTLIYAFFIEEFSRGGITLSRLRVGVDMHSVNGIQQGIRTHLLEIYWRAAQLAPDVDFYLLGATQETLLQFSPHYGAPNLHPVFLKPTDPVQRLLWQLPRIQRQLSLDWLHVQYIMPLFNTAQIAVTIHDILFETYTSYFTPFFRLRSRILMRYSAQHANLVLTVSNFSKHELVNKYHATADSVLVTPNAADRSRYYPGSDGKALIEKRGLSSGDYLLSVGRLEPRKNYGVLLQAYARLTNPPPLVIVGQRDFHFNQVFSLIASLNLHQKVKILDDVEAEELGALYRHCTLFLYPSVAEGFGMPVMEAFASGCAVITSDSTALTEIANGAALLVPPNDVDSLEGAIRQLLNYPDQRLSLSDAGVVRARQYSWDASAQALVQGLLMSNNMA